MDKGVSGLPLTRDRRSFLKTALGAWGVLLAVPVLKLLFDYVTPPQLAGVVRQSLNVAKADDIAIGTGKVVKFGNNPVIVVHLPGGQFKAFSARCTHLGCIVQFLSTPVPHFGCNCHGSQFDINGVNIAGPAPRPLAPYRVTLDGSSVVVSNT